MPLQPIDKQNTVQHSRRINTTYAVPCSEGHERRVSLWIDFAKDTKLLHRNDSGKWFVSDKAADERILWQYVPDGGKGWYYMPKAVNRYLAYYWNSGRM
jgi:hypothetical protein